MKLAQAVARFRRALGLVLAASVAIALLALALPTRTWFNQRAEIKAEEARLEVLTRENEKLAARVERLQTDEEIERLAREHYNLVRPGEEAYAILPGPTEASPHRDAQTAETAALPSVADAVPAAAQRSDDDRSLVEKVLDAVAFWR